MGLSQTLIREMSGSVFCLWYALCETTCDRRWKLNCVRKFSATKIIEYAWHSLRQQPKINIYAQNAMLCVWWDHEGII